MSLRDSGALPKDIPLEQGANQDTTLYNSREYIYSTLQPYTIRVLIVHPGISSPEPDCSLITRPIPPLYKARRQTSRARQLVPYEAPSYSWDGQSLTRVIRM